MKLVKIIVVVFISYSYLLGFDENKFKIDYGWDFGGETVYPIDLKVNEAVLFGMGGVWDISDLFDLSYGIALKDYGLFHVYSPGTTNSFSSWKMDLLISIPMGEKFRVSGGVEYYIKPQLLDKDDVIPDVNLESSWGEIYLIEYIIKEKRKITGSFGLSYSKVNFINSASGTVYNGDSLGIHLIFYIGISSIN